MALDIWNEDDQAAKHCCNRLMQGDLATLETELRDAVLDSVQYSGYCIEDVSSQLAKIFATYRRNGCAEQHPVSEEFKDFLIFRALADAASIRWRQSLLKGPSLANELIAERRAEAKREP